MKRFPHLHRLYLYVMQRLNEALSARYMIWSDSFKARAKKFSERLEELSNA